MIGQTVSHYTILEKLGEGGMGVVYRARDITLDRDVVLKFLPPDLTPDPEARERFIQEAKAASALDHPNICSIHEIGATPDGRSYIVMGYYPGETVKKKIDAGPLPWKEAVRITLGVAGGLSRAHEQGIIHRDIKPANIIITRRNEVKILDFGLAKLMGKAGLTRTGTTSGTALYMSPEQLRGGALDHRSDIWSLGAVLYEMLAGTPPFRGEYEQAVMYGILNTDPEPLSVPDLPAGIDRILRRMLAKDPKERYLAIDDAAADLRAVDEGREPETRGKLPGTMRERKRRRIVLGSIAGAAVLTALALTIFVTRTSPTVLRLEPSEYILVGDFENHTNNPIFDHSLGEAIRVSLRQSPRFNILPPERVSEALKRMKVPESHPLNDTVAVSAARREGVRAVILGDINSLGAGYVISCRVIDAASGETVSLLRREVPGTGQVLEAMDRLCEDVREVLGESIEEMSGYTMPLEKVTTPSLEALDLYSRGNIFEGQGDYQNAAILKEQAVAKDSLFTIAISDLSYIHRKLGNDSLALFYHDRVFPLLNRVTDRERFYILSIYYGPSFELDYQKAFQSIQQLVLRYPNSAEGYATLGHLAMYVGDLKTAMESNLRSLEIDSIYAGTIYNNTGYALGLSGRADEALEYFAKSKLIRPGYYAIDGYIAQCLWIRGGYDSAEQRLRSIMPLADPRRKILTYSQLASLYHFLGRLRDAAGACREAVALCRSAKRPGDEAYFHYLAGEIAGDGGSRETYRAEMRRAEQLSVSPYPELPLIGESYARAGLIDDAQRVLKRLSTAGSADPYFTKRRRDFIGFVEGAVLLARGNPVKAEAKFGSVEKIHSADPYALLSRFGIARSLEGRSDSSAVRIFEDLLAERGEVVFGFILNARNSGFWIRTLWPEVHLELGKIHARQHNREAAERHLRSCLDIWRHADDNFNKTAEAQQLLDQLTKAR